MNRLTFIQITLILLFGLSLSGCWIEEVNNPDNGNAGQDTTSVFKDVSGTHLPVAELQNNSRAAEAADLENDGDLDLVIAVESNPNKILINDGTGHFTDESDRLPSNAFASEDVALADFNSDGTTDIFFANKLDQTSEYYFNDGKGSFINASARLPFTGSSYAVGAVDVNNDGFPDLIIGNYGLNNIFINDGRGNFSDQSTTRLPNINNKTRDLAPADINVDGNLDLLIANEENNRLLLNTGRGFFADHTQTRLPLREGVEETGDVNAADVNNDGRPDLYFGNLVRFKSGTTAQDRLLINRQGQFTDVTHSQLPASNTSTGDADFFDIDDDGDFDIITGNLGSRDNASGNYSGDNFARVQLNNGAGGFSYAESNFFPANFSPEANDFEIADVNGDGRLDMYIANFGASDVLLLRREQ